MEADEKAAEEAPQGQQAEPVQGAQPRGKRKEWLLGPPPEEEEPPAAIPPLPQLQTTQNAPASLAATPATGFTNSTGFGANASGFGFGSSASGNAFGAPSAAQFGGSAGNAAPGAAPGAPPATPFASAATGFGSAAASGAGFGVDKDLFSSASLVSGNPFGFGGQQPPEEEDDDSQKYKRYFYPSPVLGREGRYPSDTHVENIDDDIHLKHIVGGAPSGDTSDGRGEGYKNEHLPVTTVEREIFGMSGKRLGQYKGSMLAPSMWVPILMLDDKGARCSVGASAGGKEGGEVAGRKAVGAAGTAAEDETEAAMAAHEHNLYSTTQFPGGLYKKRGGSTDVNMEGGGENDNDNNMEDNMERLHGEFKDSSVFGMFPEEDPCTTAFVENLCLKARFADDNAIYNKIKYNEANKKADLRRLHKAKAKPWAEKHRPQMFKDMVLDPALGKIFRKMVEHPGSITHMLLYGPPGTGKTTIAWAFLNELFGVKAAQKHVLALNSSQDRGIKIVRDTIKPFCINQHDDSLDDREKYPTPNLRFVLLDESDNMTFEAQAALRRIIEENSQDVRFILCCNFLNKVIDPIQSRCALVPFKPLPLTTTNTNSIEEDEEGEEEEDKGVKGRLIAIARAENVELEGEAAEMICHLGQGDLRKTITLLQETVATVGARSKDKKAAGGGGIASSPVDQRDGTGDVVMKSTPASAATQGTQGKKKEKKETTTACQVITADAAREIGNLLPKEFVGLIVDTLLGAGGELVQ